jgi:hypothetical protein
MANLTCPFPSNINPLSPNGFMFNITKLPDVNFFCQSINLPGLNLPSITQGTPFSDAEIPGEKLTYDTLELQFIVDEQMLNYTSVHNWITALGFPQNYDQYINFVNQDQKNTTNELMQNYSDGVLQILNNSNNPIKTVHFRDLFPTALSALTFLSTSDDVQYLVGNVSFKYTYYEFMV